MKNNRSINHNLNIIKNLLFFIGTILMLYSCTNSSQQKINIADKDIDNTVDSVFSSSLDSEISKMISVKKRREKGGHTGFNEICSVVISKSNIEECSAIVTLMSKVDTQQISGYTFVEKELVACYILSDDCSNKLINKTNLIQFKDSIAGHPYIFFDEIMVYDPPVCVYRIVDNDSLILVKSTIMN